MATYRSRFFGTRPAEFAWLIACIALVVAAVYFAFREGAVDIVWNAAVTLVPRNIEQASLQVTRIDDLLLPIANYAWMLVLLFIIAWLVGERVDVSDEGLRIFSWHPKLTYRFIPWDQVRSARVIESGASIRSVVIYYKTRFGIVASAHVQARRFREAQDLLDSITSRLGALGVKTERIKTSPWVLVSGYALLAISIATYAAMAYRIRDAVIAYTEPTASPELINSFPSPATVGAVYLLAIAGVGLGLGLLSSYHRGGISLWWAFIVGLAVGGMGDPMIYFLVWMAIEAIHNAIPTPVVSLGWQFQSASLDEWLLGLNLTFSASLAVVLSLIAGARLGFRRSSARIRWTAKEQEWMAWVAVAMVLSASSSEILDAPIPFIGWMRTFSDMVPLWSVGYLAFRAAAPVNLGIVRFLFLLGNGFIAWEGIEGVWFAWVLGGSYTAGWWRLLELLIGAAFVLLVLWDWRNDARLRKVRPV